MNKNLKRLGLFAFLSVGLFSCKKENDMFNNTLNGDKLAATSVKYLTDSRLVQQAKDWYETTTKSSSSVISTEKGTFKLKFATITLNLTGQASIGFEGINWGLPSRSNTGTSPAFYSNIL